jgi:hypothetical protein
VTPRGGASVDVPAGGATASATFTVDVPAGTRPGRHVLTADIDIDGEPRGELAETLLEVLAG